VVRSITLFIQQCVFLPYQYADVCWWWSCIWRNRTSTGHLVCWNQTSMEHWM